MPAAVVAGEGMYLVYHHGPHVCEPPLVGDARRHQHRLKRLGGRKQYVGRLGEQPIPLRLVDVAVPAAHSPADELPVAVEALVEVVEQRPQRADVQHGQAPPILGEYPRQQRQHRRLGLAAGGGGGSDQVVPGEDRLNGGGLQRPQPPPAQAVDDVMLHGRVQELEGRGRDRVGHGFRSRSISSTESPHGRCARRQ
jgi:hypothetical protein